MVDRSTKGMVQDAHRANAKEEAVTLVDNPLVRSALHRGATGEDRGPASGPLRVHRANPRYFADPDGNAVLLTGSHTWTGLQDAGRSFPPDPFDWSTWLARLAALGHSCFRMWAWEQATWVAHDPGEFVFDPLPWARTGPGNALDGRPLFDLDQFDERYFSRLRARVADAGHVGIYVVVMLFQGWSVEWKQFALAPGRNPWLGHPFNRSNNRNGFDGDPAGTGEGLAPHPLRLPAVAERQRAYVDRVVATVGDLPNVLYEVSNEDQATAEDDAWQDEVLGWIANAERTRGFATHPRLRTVQWPSPASHASLLASPAEAVSFTSPGNHGTGLEDYCGDPPAADGRKVSLLDTDHLWGVGGDAGWVWRAALRGHNPLFMDPFEGDFVAHGHFGTDAREAMGVARALLEGLGLDRLVPAPERASSRFALADADLATIVALVPDRDAITVDVGTNSRYRLRWVHKTSGLGHAAGHVTGPLVRLAPPWTAGTIAVLECDEPASDTSAEIASTPKTVSRSSS